MKTIFNSEERLQMRHKTMIGSIHLLKLEFYKTLKQAGFYRFFYSIGFSFKRF